MSKEFPLFPELSETGNEEAQKLIEAFKVKLSEAASDAISDLYCDMSAYIESDSWGNFRNKIMDGFKNYDTRKLQNAYDFKKIRAQMFKDYREDIIKDLDQDIFQENIELKKQIEHLSTLLEIANKRY